MSAYFITATGTGTGKTFATCALLHASKGRARAYKPILSGFDGAADSDAAQLIAAGGNRQTLEEMSPWRFAAPLSPHRAAALENKSIPFDTLVEWTKERAAQPGLTLIEGIGGLMVPLDNHHTLRDWLQACALPTILVTGTYLGAINHTLMTLALLEQVGIPLHVLIVSESRHENVGLEETRAGLEPFIATIPLRVFQPLVSSWAQATAIHPLLETMT